MKKILLSLIFLASLLFVTACGSSTDSTADSDVIVVGASPKPHAEILEVVKDALADEGYTLEIQEFTDYVTPNQALADGDIDANYFQHLPYLEDYDAENGTDLVSVGTVHYEPIAIYAGKTTSLDEIADGATIAVPNDTTNEARALLLLEDNGLITLAEGVGLEATVNDIVDNPKNLNITELEAAQLARSLQDVDLAVINGNYAIDAGLDVNEALASETADSEAAQAYANVIAVRSEDKDNAKIQALLKALQSDEVKEYIETEYNGAVVPLFTVVS